MKLFILTALAVLSFHAQNASAQQVQINVDFTNNTVELTAKDGGMVVDFGGTKMARRRVPMAAGTLKISSQVITNDMYLAKVVGMNPTTKQITVQIDSNNYNYAIPQLAVTNGCNMVYCVGEPIRTNDMYAGVVAGLFADGTTAVQIDNTYYNYKPAQLGLKDACVQNFCTGDKIITNDGYNGTVDAIFSDGSMSILVGSSAYRYQAAQLSMTQAICANIYADRVSLCQ